MRLNALTMIDVSTDTAKHSYTDFGYILKSCTIDAPEPQLHKVEVVGRNGAVDMTEAIGGTVKYNERNINMEFRYMGAIDTRTSRLSDFENFAHGQLMKFIFDDDEAFYYLGRIDSVAPTVNGSVQDITVHAIVDPYKYNITTSAEDWLWDPFDFEEGIINETANMEVDGTLTYTLVAQRRWENPIIVSDSAMTVSYDGGTPINIVVGSQVMYDIIITVGEHTFTFVGNGTVTINYVGGML